ncbi:hypothetical protein OSB04_018940 [Centaurea solstitialis]|uniref:DUF4219 domain-containing protein n=1 Tax=Centaurea solstitialis TaxID=347529 RepID=A0AA38W2D4_9ASTR|nr:hypothetical protein OSB04_018940 [Centaurea solstitialis]
MTGKEDKGQGDSSKILGSTTHFSCPILNSTNYTTWAIRMQVILEANGLWDMIEPQPTTQADAKKDKTATAYLYQALPEEQLLLISKYKTANAVWDALKTRHVGVDRVQQAKQQTLKMEFEMLQMKENESIDSFTTKLTGFVNKAASVEQYSNLDTMSLDEAIGRLKTFEERLNNKKERSMDIQEGLMFTRHENQGQNREEIYPHLAPTPKKGVRLESERIHEGGEHRIKNKRINRKHCKVNRRLKRNHLRECDHDRECEHGRECRKCRECGNGRECEKRQGV